LFVRHRQRFAVLNRFRIDDILNFTVQFLYRHLDTIDADAEKLFAEIDLVDSMLVESL
jgi:hypothetical protein